MLRLSARQNPTLRPSDQPAPFRASGRPCKGIGFHLGDRIKIAREGRGCEVVYSLALNRFNGNLHWQVLVLDVKNIGN